MVNNYSVKLPLIELKSLIAFYSYVTIIKDDSIGIIYRGMNLKMI